MTCKLLLLLLSASVPPLLAQGPSLTATIEREAEKCAKALMADDYATELAYTHERVISMMGGRDVALGLLKRSMAEMKSKGFGVDDTRIGTPQEPQQIGSWMVSLVPETLMLRTPSTKAQQESFLLGISADTGKTWKFIDLGPLSEEQLFNVFPELKGQIKIPPKKSPVVVGKSP